MESTMVWPPQSLAVHAVEIINECELMEVLPEKGKGKQYLSVVELAALLYTGEYVHAQQVWQRWGESNPPALLLDWWKVGAAMMDCDAVTIWQGLSHIQANHPAPLNQYANEVGTAYRQRILQQHPPTQPYLSLLNFSSAAELEQFCDQHRVGPKYPNSDSMARNGMASPATSHVDGKASLTQVVAFLESTTGNVRT